MEGAPKSSTLPKELQAMYENVKRNPRFADISEADFLEIRAMALGDHPAEAHNFTSHNGLMMEETPNSDELTEIRKENSTQ
jgi:hypothetical protein